MAPGYVDEGNENTGGSVGSCLERISFGFTGPFTLCELYSFMAKRWRLRWIRRRLETGTRETSRPEK